MLLPSYPIRILYDGNCVVCATEIEHYLRRDAQKKLIPVDISAADFDPGQFGLTYEECMRELHVLDNQDVVYRGVDAFQAIWRAFPEKRIYQMLAQTASLPGIRGCARLAYRGFARVRKHLPKRQRCGHGSCVRPGQDHREQ